jgi:DNA-binding CsgD family transcriptional regulator
MFPRFAIIEPNVLTGLGLQNILEDIIPMAEIKQLQTFEEVLELKTEDFVHFFVSSRIYFEHTQFFRQQAAKSIVLVNGDMAISGVKTINVCQGEKDLVRDILALNRSKHGPHGSMPIAHHVAMHPQKSPYMILSPREIEVAVLLSKGCINKEVADRLDISLATAISHRKNIMDKLHARSLADVIVYVVMNGLADVSEL